MTVLYFKRKYRRFPYHIVGKIERCVTYTNFNNDVNVKSRCGSYIGTIYFGPFGGIGVTTFETYDKAPDDMVCLNCLKRNTTDNTANKEQS